MKLREHPTLPSDEKLEAVDRGELWPRAFCAFVGCKWSAMEGDEEQLAKHIQEVHGADLDPIAACMPRGNAEDAFLSIYNAAIANKCRSQAPIAGCSLDRKAIKSFVEACKEVEALVCFVCGCTHTRVEEDALEGKGGVQWVKPVQPRMDTGELLFLDRPVDEAGCLLSLNTFLERYGKISDGGPNLQDLETFGDWCLTWPSNVQPAGRRVLCCPEDRLRTIAPMTGVLTHTIAIIKIPASIQNGFGFACRDSALQDRRCCAGHDPHDVDLCEGCELPICSKCKGSLSKGELPALALANDMWTGYAPHRLIEQKVTVMEAICACPCVTTLVCMSMEARYEDNVRQEAREAAPLNSTAQMARHRFGARGNALTFPLPLEDLFLALQGLGEDAAPLELPRCGAELAQVARVLLKTNKEGATTEEDIKTLIHQALVRREARLRRHAFHFLSAFICLRLSKYHA